MDLTFSEQFYYDKLIKEISGSCDEGIAQDIIERVDDLIDEIFENKIAETSYDKLIKGLKFINKHSMCKTNYGYCLGYYIINDITNVKIIDEMLEVLEND